MNLTTKIFISTKSFSLIEFNFQRLFNKNKFHLAIKFHQTQLHTLILKEVINQTSKIILLKQTVISIKNQLLKNELYFAQ
jgi:hypothetical protein